MAAKRLLNPEFVEAVHNAPMTRCLIAQLVGYGPHHSNLHRDLTRTDGTPQTPMVRERMAKLAQLIGFPARWDLVEVYRDDGVSGALTAGRVDFQRMLADARAGVFDALVFFDLDRFSRNAHKGMEALNELLDLGVEVWDFSTGEQVTLDSFESEMTVTMKLQLAQLSRMEKQKHSRAAAHKYAKDGVWVGSAPFGYEIVGEKKQKRLKPKPAEAAVVVEIYTRAANGEGYRSIAEALNLRKVPAPRAQLGRPSGWSMMTVLDILKREIYRGVMVFGKAAMTSTARPATTSCSPAWRSKGPRGYPRPDTGLRPTTHGMATMEGC